MDKERPEDPGPPPARGPRGEREARLARALRDNLRRRKSAGVGEPKKPPGTHRAD